MTGLQTLALIVLVGEAVMLVLGYASLQRSGELVTPVRWLVWGWLALSGWLALVVLTQ